MGVVAKRSSMVFYSDPISHYSHRVRIVLAEKGVTVEVIDVNVNDDNLPEDLVTLNPYNSLPTMVDRDLVLYEANVMMEYLDERFPHPPLLPVYPVARAQSRLWISRIEKDWCALAEKILGGTGKGKEADKARKELTDSLLATAPIFQEMPYFMSEEFSLVDCCVAPVLWRLPKMGIDLSNTQCGPLLEYMERLFARDAFQESLSELEKEMLAP